jgi:hypothetical protein
MRDTTTPWEMSPLFPLFTGDYIVIPVQPQG